MWSFCSEPTYKPKPGECDLVQHDLELSYDKLVDFYSLRFQIEFNFRDANNTGVWKIS